MHALLPLLGLALPILASPAQTPFQLAPARVPVLLGVMSRCPDARVCETVWDRVLARIPELVDVQAVYIGKINPESKYGVDCMHGVEECTGNIQQLCAYEAWQSRDGDKQSWRDWWDFVQCMNYGPTSRIGDREIAEQCAKVVGHDWEKEVHHCVTSDHGARLLQKSVERAQALDIVKSCTMVINHKKVCVHDSTWKDCDGGHEVGDFVYQVKEQWKILNPGKELPRSRRQSTI
ncbi:hypothetical protein RQP46_001545 [Phenoliferia psychrophenolica]